jgi:hypothetical protein
MVPGQLTSPNAYRPLVQIQMTPARSIPRCFQNPNTPPPPPPACALAASFLTFSLAFIVASRNLATHRSRHTLSPLLSSASWNSLPTHFCAHVSMSLRDDCQLRLGRAGKGHAPPEDVGRCLHFSLDGGHALGRGRLFLTAEQERHVFREYGSSMGRSQGRCVWCRSCWSDVGLWRH